MLFLCQVVTVEDTFIKLSTSDNAILAFLLGYQPLYLLLMEMNAAHIARHKIFLAGSQVSSATKWMKKTDSLSYLQKKHKKLGTIPSQ